MYSGPNHQPLLLDGFCAFVDLLGFVNLTAEAYANGQGTQLFNRLTDALAMSLQMISHDVQRDLWEFRFFTDNLVIGYPVTRAQLQNELDRGEPQFGQSINVIMSHQLSMAAHGFPARGGLSYGQLHIGEHVVYGDSLLEAYGLEQGKKWPSTSRISFENNQLVFLPMAANQSIDIVPENNRSPRVLVSDDVTAIVDYQLRAYASIGAAPHDDMMLVDEIDDLIFLNYLHIAVDPIFRQNLLALHRQVIQTGLAENNNVPSVLAKFSWLARYHNYFITHRIPIESRPQFLIPGIATTGFHRLSEDASRLAAFNQA